MERLAGMQNTVASHNVPTYGKKLMERMGWAEYVVCYFPNLAVEKDLERMIGYKEAQANRWNECWWFDAYDSAAKKIDSDSDSNREEKSPRIYSDAELFAACKGRRLGMRARASQKGKWERAEDPGTLPSIPVSIYDEEKKKKKHRKDKKKEEKRKHKHRHEEKKEKKHDKQKEKEKKHKKEKKEHVI
ncbi:hypothetical protein JH06_4291 [Blastocystis sp. subtype 4]|uniref:hypothetical protein n=1 Tax=Blastocystis sp. subtype 4 TaxID=944170 RepID=UPI000711D8A0|nr:hypothetical protein JH06_4291 [Blastocystis sp. subtype 4]KNB42275.1 hypothetical protein JH06_4291 [Blastocystis sp. subtype 4]|eukprot:XP_014525718.1 hypothetical protein JH06_4291 [Blastocystis sp. subtype 4]